MKFCVTCGNILTVKTSEDGKFLFCKKCNKNFPLTEDMKISYSFKDDSKEIKIVEGRDLEFPTTKILCPECNEVVEAFWWMQQTRGADEPPTRFYECKKCKHRWREYS
jgi:DNA-directed RNA polymerase subunit M